MTPEERAYEVLHVQGSGQWPDERSLIQAIAAQIREAVLEEREACAQCCCGYVPSREHQPGDSRTTRKLRNLARAIERAIRARGEDDGRQDT